MRGLLWAPLATAVVANNGVQTVLKMLDEMVVKGQAGIEEEKALYNKIEKTVNERVTSAEIAIKRQTELIEKFESRKEANTARAEELDSLIAERDSENQAIQAQLDKEIAIRADEKKVFQDTEADLAQAVDQIGRAIGVLKSGSVTLKADFLQKLADASAPIRALLIQQPQASKKAYETKSNGVIALCKEMEDKLKTDLSDLRSGEANAANAHAVAKSAMENDIKVNERAISDMKIESGEKKEAAGVAAKDEAQARSDLADAKTLLSDTKTYWAEQTTMFESNLKYRNEELNALNEAIQIIDSESALKLLQMKATSFLQVRVKVDEEQNTRRKSVLASINAQLLETNMRIYGSQKTSALSLLSAQIMTGSPFDKIIKMLEDLVAKLEADATAEEAHHQWCKEELSTTEAQKTKVTKEYEELLRNQDKLTSEKEQAAEEEKEARSEAKTMQEEMAQAEKDRAEEKAENEKTIADATAAQTAISSALDVLKQFYGSEEGAALLQQDPTIKAYGGQGDSAGGVVGLMETILSDFAQLEGETRAAETTAATEHRRYVKHTKKTIVKKLDLASEKKLVQIEKTGALNSLKKKIDTKSNELAQVSKYWDELQPMCVPKQMSYEERAAKREEEIKALQEAYKVLEEEANK